MLSGIGFVRESCYPLFLSIQVNQFSAPRQALFNRKKG